MKILITGGSGFIGQSLCRSLIAEGHDVIILSRRPSQAAQLLAPAHVIDRFADAAKVDAVVNLAGASIGSRRWTTQRKQTLRHSRLAMTESIYRWIAAMPVDQRPQCVISGSAIGYYGDHGDATIDETTLAGTDFAAQLCRDWEREAERIGDLGPRVSVLRSGIVLGQGGGALKQLSLPYRVGLGGPLGHGQQWMSWIHLTDEVRLIQWLIAQGQAGAYNATAPSPLRNHQFAHSLARALNRPCWFTVPSWMLSLALGEMASTALCSQRVIPQRAQTEGFQFRYPTFESAIGALYAPSH